MKKVFIVFLVVCFSLAFIAMTPKPAYADDPPPVGLIIGLAGTIGLIGALIAITTSDNNQANKHKQDMQVRDSMENDLNSKVGKWTYDEMLSEKGAPTSVVDGDKIKVATYDGTKTATVGSTVYHAGNFLSEASSDYKAGEVRSGEIFTFTFDKKKNTLKDWHYKKYAATKSKGGGSNIQEYGYNGTVETEKAAAESAPETGASTLQKKLQDLKDLLKSGDITKAEYDKMREKLLDEVK